MQLMADGVAGVGNRHGIIMDPVHRRCSVVRFDRFPQQVAFELIVGVVIDGKEYVLPLGEGGEAFDFLDQRTTPCSVVLMGIHAASCIKLRVEVIAPFRPRDAAFSALPIIDIRVTAESFDGIFRWEKRTLKLTEAEVFVELRGEAMTQSAAGDDAVDVRFASTRFYQWAGMKDFWDAKTEKVPQHDRLVAPGARRDGVRLRKMVKLNGAEALDVLWCMHSTPVYEVRGERWAFKYAEQFADLEAVCDFARAHPEALFENAMRVNAILGANDFSQSINQLLAFTLHSWAINTWAAVSGKGEEFFGVWEGSCYMTSTLDVEFTQAPFYLAVWPELLGLELDHWTEHTQDGRKSLGERGAGTLFFSHDMGTGACANGHVYHHDMEVEETSNWLIMACCHWRRTGDDAVVRKHAAGIEKYLRFLELADTTGNGVPDVGIANTIDDASPAVQYGREQVYLAVKTMGALVAGAKMLEHLGKGDLARRYAERAEMLGRYIEKRGWQGDHFATLLEKSGHLKNPWSGQETTCAEIPGWNSPQIYTANALGLLDMVGIDVPLDREKLRTDLRTATGRCLREYGCVHSDFQNENPEQLATMLDLVGNARSPGWISMNMARDIAAFYRGVDLRHLADRYWNWQVTTNTQEPRMFFETFSGNNLCFYPRGVAIWGFYDALAGRVIDRAGGIDRESRPFGELRSPRLIDVRWV